MCTRLPIKLGMRLHCKLTWSFRYMSIFACYLCNITVSIPALTKSFSLSKANFWCKLKSHASNFSPGEMKIFVVHNVNHNIYVEPQREDNTLIVMAVYAPSMTNCKGEKETDRGGWGHPESFGDNERHREQKTTMRNCWRQSEAARDNRRHWGREGNSQETMGNIGGQRQ